MMVWTHPPAGETEGHCFLAGWAVLGDQESTGFGEAGAVTILCQVHRRVGCCIADSISLCVGLVLSLRWPYDFSLCVQVCLWDGKLGLCCVMVYCIVPLAAGLMFVTWCFVVLY